METENVQVELVYDPLTHKEKIQLISQYTLRLQNVRYGKGMLPAVLLSIYPVLQDSEALIKYFETLIEVGQNFGVLIPKVVQTQLNELRDAVNTIRNAANREFFRGSRWN